MTPVPTTRMRSARLQRADRAPRDATSTRPSRRIASCPSRGRLPCAALPSHRDLEPRESFVPDGNRHISRLGDDGRVGGPPGHERIGADARMLLVDDRSNRRGGRDRAHPMRRSTRAASIIAATPAFMSCEPRPYTRPSRTTGSNGASIPATPTVSVCPQNISARPARAPFEHADDVGASRRRLLQFDVEPRVADRHGDRFGDGALARCTGHKSRVDGVYRDEIAEEATAASIERSAVRIAAGASRILPVRSMSCKPRRRDHGGIRRHRPRDGAARSPGAAIARGRARGAAIGCTRSPAKSAGARRGERVP